MENDQDNEYVNTNSKLGKLIVKVNQLEKKPVLNDALSDILDTFLQKLKQSEHYLKNGIFQINFAEAALLLQSSAFVYSKKVDLLWDSVNQCQKRMIAFNSEENQKELNRLEERERKYKRKRKTVEKTNQKEKTSNNSNEFHIDWNDVKEFQHSHCEKDPKLLTGWYKKMVVNWDLQPTNKETRTLSEKQSHFRGLENSIYDKDQDDEFVVHTSKMESVMALDDLFTQQKPKVEEFSFQLYTDLYLMPRYLLQNQLIYDDLGKHSDHFEKFVSSYRDKHFPDDDTNNNFMKSPSELRQTPQKLRRISISSTIASKLNRLDFDRIYAQECQVNVLRLSIDELSRLSRLSVDELRNCCKSHGCTEDFNLENFQENDVAEKKINIEQCDTTAIAVINDGAVIDLLNDNDVPQPTEDVQSSDVVEAPESAKVSDGDGQVPKTTVEIIPETVKLSETANSHEMNSDSIPVNSDSLTMNSDSLPVNSDSPMMNSDSLPVNSDSLLENSDSLPMNSDSLPVNRKSLTENSDPLLEDGVLLFEETEEVKELEVAAKRIVKRVKRLIEEDEVEDEDILLKRRKLSKAALRKLATGVTVDLKEFNFFFATNYQPADGEGIIDIRDFEFDDPIEASSVYDHEEDLPLSQLRESVICAQDSGICAQDSGICAQDSEMCAQDSGICATDSGMCAQDSAQESAICTQDSGYESHFQDNDNLDDADIEMLSLIPPLDQIEPTSPTNEEMCQAGTSNQCLREDPINEDREDQHQEFEPIDTVIDGEKPLYQKVYEWKQFMQEKFKKTNSTDFDIHKYGSNIMENLDSDRPKKFGDIVKGRTSAEVTRFFISALQLANTCNIEIQGGQNGKLSNETFALKLVSKDRYYDRLKDYVAPSEEDFSERLATAQKLKKCARPSTSDRSSHKRSRCKMQQNNTDREGRLI